MKNSISSLNTNLTLFSFSKSVAVVTQFDSDNPPIRRRIFFFRKWKSFEADVSRTPRYTIYIPSISIPLFLLLITTQTAITVKKRKRNKKSWPEVADEFKRGRSFRINFLNIKKKKKLLKGGWKQLSLCWWLYSRCSYIVSHFRPKKLFNHFLLFLFFPFSRRSLLPTGGNACPRLNSHYMQHC